MNTEIAKNSKEEIEEVLNNLTIEQARIILLQESYFYATLLQNCRFTWDDKATKTAFVGITPSAEIVFVASKAYWNRLPGLKRVGLLLHELLHLLNDHLVRGKDFLPLNIANFAADAAINQYMPEPWLFENWITPSRLNLPNGLSFERYFELLLKDPDKAKDFELADSHEFFFKIYDPDGKGESNVLSDANVDIAKTALDDLIIRSYNEAKSKRPGLLDSHIEEAVSSRFTPAKVNWRHELKNKMGSVISREIKQTYSRINRRYGMPYPGRKKTYSPKVLLAFDESGSVSDNVRSALLSEVKDILPNCSDRTELFFFDTKVCVEKMYIDRLSVMPTRKARGGTSFNAAVEYANEQRPDLLIICTDGEDKLTIPKPSYEIIWVICGTKKCENLPGKKIYIDDVK
jgi:predicted metal-dependent peptidase